MSFLQQMAFMKKILVETGIPCIIPSTDEDYRKYFSNISRDDFKRKMSNDYIKKIKQLETQGILVINIDKYGIPDYIGPNTFAEIVISQINNKKVYILNGIPEMYADELTAWNVKSYGGNYKNIINDIIDDFYADSLQMELFEDM
jgi:hypothetical protein